MKPESTQALKKRIAHLEAKISKLSHTETALKKERDFIYQVLNWIDSLVVVIDLNGFIISFNRASEQLSGYCFEELQDRPFWDTLILPEERNGVKKTIKDVIHKDLPRSFQNHWITKSGQKKLISWKNSILRKDDGSTEYILCTGLDITEQIQAEKALRESENKYRVLVQNANSIIMCVDPEGNFTFFNKFAERFFGYKEHEIIGRNPGGIIVPETESSGRNLTTLIEDIIEAPDHYTINENENIRRNGERVWIAWTNKAIYDEHQQLAEILCIGNDITERKRLEEQLQRAQKMEAIGTLAGGVAHDLNNVLSGIVSYPELLLLDLPEDSPLTLPILRIKESGQKAAAIVQDLLTLARRGVSVTEIVNINDIVRNFLGTPEFEKMKSFHPQVTFTVNLDPNLLNIIGSPLHLSKTVMNLVSNAAEALPTGGEVIVSTENQYIDRPIHAYEDVMEGDYALLRVTDSGVGMSPEDLKQVFEPFFTKKVMGRSGTGLGMAVVWGTVKDHNGFIDVHSEKGKGTTCNLFFPVTRLEKSDSKVEISIAECRGNEKILVVDDIREQREIVSKLLKKLGYTVITARSGEIALEYLKKNAVDLILMDMIMDPGIDGLETYRRILKVHPGQKAIITSGFSETERVKEALKLGAGAYVKKPYILEKISKAIRAELDQQSLAN